MYTRCTHCAAVFKVTTSELTALDGNVRCGECGQVFNGLDKLTVLPPDGSPDAATPAPPAHAAYKPEIESTSAATVGTETAPSTTPTDDTHGETVQAEVPSEIPPETPRTQQTSDTPTESMPLVLQAGPGASASAPRRATIRPFLAATCGLLILLLAGQAAFHERERLLAYPELAPTVRWVCERLGCALAPQRDPDAYQISERNIYSHPTESEALMVQARFVNRADFPQPPPMVELSFRDLQGRLLAVRRFTPSEYRPGGPSAALHAPGELLDMLVEIEDPGPQAVSYEFRFH